jgi:hypothetical protein
MKNFSLWISTLSIAVPLTTSVAAQVGGESEILIRSTRTDFFGNSVAGIGDIDADGTPDLLVSRPMHRAQGMLFAGSVYAISGATGATIHRISGTFPDQHLSRHLAAAGDVNNDGTPDFILGCTQDSPGGVFYAGSALVYSGATGSLLYRFDGTAPHQRLGESIDGAGDINADGYADMIIGSDLDYNGYPYDSVQVFSGFDGSALAQFSYSEALGDSVTGIGDANGDGVDDIFFAGWVSGQYSATIFSGATLTPWISINVPGHMNPITHNDYRLEAAGDVNQDGFNDVIISLPTEGLQSGDFRGTVYVFSGLDGELIHRIHGPDFSTSSSNRTGFGQAIASVGDVDGDGAPDILVGAPEYSKFAWDAGGYLLYSGATGALLSEFIGHTQQQRWGFSVAGVGDLNHDGLDDFFVGGPGLGFSGIDGIAQVISFRPFLRADRITVPSTSGATLDLQFDFPLAAANTNYKVLMSTEAGVSHRGVDIPLGQSLLLQNTFQGIYPLNTHSGLRGTLDPFGQASASIGFPANTYTHLSGRSFWLAVVSYPTGSGPAFSSIATPLTFEL